MTLGKMAQNHYHPQPFFPPYYTPSPELSPFSRDCLLVAEAGVAVATLPRSHAKYFPLKMADTTSCE